MATKTLTAVGISAALSEAKKTNKTIWVSDGSIPRSHGGLQLRAAPSGRAVWYWRYSVGEKKIRMSLGVYSAQVREGFMTLPEARAEVGVKAALYQEETSKDVRTYLDREQAREQKEAEAAEQAAAAVAKAAEQAATKTLSALMAVYVAHQTKLGKQSAYDAGNLVKNHLDGASPEIAQLQANKVSAENIASVLRPLTTRGNGRTAAKLRSYLRAAYALAARARVDVDVSGHFVDFDIATNPVENTGTLSRFNNTRDRVLTKTELQTLWQRLKTARESVVNDAAMLCIALGGQRPTQLVRVTINNVDSIKKTITMYDPKGRRQQPRPHVLPLTDEALVIIERGMKRAKLVESEYLFPVSRKAVLRADTLGKYVATISDAMLAAGEISEPFQLRDLRRTAETLMIDMRVDQGLRAQLLSHGLSGIQHRHYDRHNYLDDMREVLDRWAKMLEAVMPPNNVIELHSKTA